jgi:hypothetical protein
MAVAYGAIHGVMLPAIRLTGDLTELTRNSAAGASGTTATGGDPAGFGQHHPAPGFSIGVAVPVLSDDMARADGAVEVKVLLNPRGGFTGAVKLSVEDLPEGLEAEFRQNPVMLDGPKEVTVLVRGQAAPGVARVVASSGKLSQETRIALSLAPGSIRCEMPEAAVRRGETGALRVVFETVTGRGRGVRVRLGALPAGLSVKARGLRSSAEAPEFDLTTLTPEMLVERRDDLRVRIGVPKPEGEEPPPATPAVLLRVPKVVGESGAFLGPGGFLDLEVAAAADMAPGTYRVPVEWNRGAVKKTETVEITVE